MQIIVTVLTNFGKCDQYMRIVTSVRIWKMRAIVIIMTNCDIYQRLWIVVTVIKNCEFVWQLWRIVPVLTILHLADWVWHPVSHVKNVSENCQFVIQKKVRNVLENCFLTDIHMSQMTVFWHIQGQTYTYLTDFQIFSD